MSTEFQASPSEEVDGVFVATGPCEGCGKEGHGTSKTHARKGMKAKCRECRSSPASPL